MTSYAEIAAKNPTSASQSNNSRDSMESLGQIRRSPSRRDHFRAPPQMEDSVLLAEELPTCNVERLLDASTPSTPSDYYTILEEFDLKIIEDEDEAAAILAWGNTRDLPTSTGSGNHELPGTSQGVNTHNGNSELPGTSQEGNNNTGNSPPNEATNSPGPHQLISKEIKGLPTTPQSLQTENGILLGESLRSRKGPLNLPSKM